MPKKQKPTTSRKKVSTEKKSLEKKTLDKKSVQKKASLSGPMGFTPYKEKKGEAYMNEKQLDHFRKILNLWKEQLYAERDVTVQHMQDEALVFADPVDRASIEEEYTLELRARDRERKFIKKIDEALSRIDQGEYGYCDVCDAEIGIKRLEARPTATQCIDCKTIDEIREKQTGGIVE